MNRYIKLHLVDAFSKEVNKGNRAGVVFNADELTSEQMQSIATFANVSETAFILNSKNPNTHDIHVKYFTPKTEVPICGHATIAAHYLRAKKQNIGEGRILSKTGAGILPIDVVIENSEPKIIMTQGRSEIGETLSNKQKEFLRNALNISHADFVNNLPVQIVSTGHSKVMVPIKNRRILNTIKPNLEKLNQLSNEIHCNGFFVFSINDNRDKYKTHGRMFAPAIGIPEDPVTGNANGPAGLYMSYYDVIKFKEKHSYKAIQGEAIGKPGVIEVTLRKSSSELPQIRVAGVAIEAKTLTYEL